LQTYRASLGIADRLAAADPSNAGWQWAFVKFSALKKSGRFVSPQDEQYLEQLRRKLNL